MKGIPRALIALASLLAIPVIVTAQVSAKSAQAPDFGTVGTTYKQFSIVSFVPTDSSTAYTTSGPAADQVLREVSSATPVAFAANLDLPQGALITYLELDGCDSSSGGNLQGTLVQSDAIGQVGYSAPSLTSSAGGCVTLNEDLTSAGVVVDNQHNHYWLLAYVANVGSTTPGLAGMVVGYRLQVPPAPASSDFSDVPTSSPQFQFIEALYHSGITAGCGGGNYCPDNPVTRGQMAVFLAKALGLN